MKQVTTTISLGIFAVLSLIAALIVNMWTLPGNDTQTELIGEAFYPEFADPMMAASLRLSIWDEDKKKPKDFEIKKVDDLWTIPLYDDYPVESSERLNQTAGSVVGILRESKAGSSSEQHSRYGVIDPLHEDAKLHDASEIGSRISIYDDSKNMLCDLIIGNVVGEDSDDEDAENRDLVAGQTYYVRQPDQNDTYTAFLNLDISTELKDWIDSDLLKVGSATVNRIELKNYDIKAVNIEEFGGRVPVRDGLEDLKFSKDGDWKLNGLNEMTEELDSTQVNSLSSSLKNLEIIGVEVKPNYSDTDVKVLNPDLSVNLPPGMDARNGGMIERQMTDLLGEKGFIPGLANKESRSPILLSQGGELNFGTDDGLVYHMVFGLDTYVQGSDFEFAKSKKIPDADEKEDEKSGEKTDESNSKDASPEENKKKPKGTKGKIMSVYVSFDETLIDKPSPPVPPVPPIKPVKKTAGETGDPKPDPKKAPDSKSPSDLKKSTNENRPDNSDEKPKQTKNDLKNDKPKKGADEKTGKEEAPKTTAPKASANENGKGDPKNADPKNAESKGAEPKATEPKGGEADSSTENSSQEDGCGFVGDDQEKEESKTESSKSDPAKTVKQDADSKAVKKQEKDPESKTKPKTTDSKGKDSPKSNESKSEKQSTEPKQEKSGAEKTGAPKTGEKTPGDSKGKQGDKEQEKTEPELTEQQKLDLEFEKQMADYVTAQKQYETELEEFKTATEQYEKDLEAYQEKIKENEKKVKNLNSRFGDWFYIVDAKNLSELKLKRSEVVGPKKSPPMPGGHGGGIKLPGLDGLPPNLNLPNIDPTGDLPKAPKSVPDDPKKAPKEPLTKPTPDSTKTGDGKTEKGTGGSDPSKSKSVEPEKSKSDSPDSPKTTDSNKDVPNTESKANEPNKSDPKATTEPDKTKSKKE